MLLSFEYKASPEQFGPNELLDYSVLHEQRGFDSGFISDRFQPGRPTGGGHGPFFSIARLGMNLYADQVLPRLHAVFG